jgi:FG-GAP-like repeat
MPFWGRIPVPHRSSPSGGLRFRNEEDDMSPLHDLRALAVIAAFVLPLAAGSLSAQTYGLPNSLPAGTSPASVFAADFDSDGDDDLVIADAANATATIYVNNAGVFAVGATLATVANPLDIQAFDADGDDDLDLAVLGGQSNAVAIYLNDGSGSFSTGAFYPAGFGPFRMLPIDGDGDGDLDLLVSNNIVNAISLLINDGSGAFTFAGATPNIPGPAGLAKADFDEDGDDDVVIACAGADVILLLRNDVTALNPVSFISVGAVPLDVIARDLNHDERPDIVTTNVAGSSISVMLNARGFNFPRNDYTTPATPVGLAVTNSENSLGLDLAVACFDAWQVAVMTNNGQGAFAFSYTTYTGVNPIDVVSIDVDGDFKDDHVSVELTGSTLTTVLNARVGLLYPGTNEDIEAGTGVSAPASSGPSAHFREVATGSFVEIGMHSPMLTMVNKPALLVAQFFFRGFPPIAPISGLHVNEFGFGPIIAINSPALSPLGEVVQFNMPPGVEGLSLMVQAISLDPTAANGIFASSPGYELAIVP